MSEPTYVYEGTEVKKTGRSARRESKRGKKEITHEITPALDSVGTWKKWVYQEELFEVVPEGTDVAT